jgi:uncharacterized protein with HEPN domain
MSKREPQLLIEDIIESGNKILEYTRDLTFDEFANDEWSSLKFSGRVDWLLLRFLENP